MEPRHITTGLGKTVFFPCTYRGSSVNPLWIISFPDGTSKFVSTTRLPVKLRSNSTGLLIIDVDESHNMTGYSCVLQAFDHNKIVLVSSSVGVLTVLESVIFSFIMNTNTTRMSEGDIPPQVAVSKSGYSRDTHLIDVLVKVLTGDGSKENRVQLWFHPSTDEHNVTLPLNKFTDDSIPERLSKVLVEILKVDVYGMNSGANIEVPQPLLLSIYDNDCKCAPLT